MTSEALTRVTASAGHAMGVRDGQTSFEEAVAPLMSDLLAYFVRRVIPREDSADCLSETMLILWRKRQQLPNVESERRAWAFGVAKRVISNQKRGRMRRTALADRVREEVRESVPPHEEEADLLTGLPELEKELMRLIVWDGFGVAEAGALLGLKPSAARMRFARAKRRLRARLRPQPPTPPVGSGTTLG